MFRAERSAELQGFVFYGFEDAVMHGRVLGLRPDGVVDVSVTEMADHVRREAGVDFGEDGIHPLDKSRDLVEGNGDVGVDRRNAGRDHHAGGLAARPHFAPLLLILSDDSIKYVLAFEERAQHSLELLVQGNGAIRARFAILRRRGGDLDEDVDFVGMLERLLGFFEHLKVILDIVAGHIFESLDAPAGGFLQAVEQFERAFE